MALNKSRKFSSAMALYSSESSTSAVISSIPSTAKMYNRITMMTNVQVRVIMEFRRPWTSSQRVWNLTISRNTRARRASRRIRTTMIWSSSCRELPDMETDTIKSTMPQMTRKMSNLTHELLKPALPNATKRKVSSTMYVVRKRYSATRRARGTGRPARVIEVSHPMANAFSKMIRPNATSKPGHATSVWSWHFQPPSPLRADREESIMPLAIIPSGIRALLLASLEYDGLAGDERKENSP
mmetsp:Transcript_25285/g.69531  ORF Transcript_25285/g.69531 Transcript_25285/m.69531 type:complete len:241 (+) Transcript_25285:498-1220(+)